MRVALAPGGNPLILDYTPVVFKDFGPGVGAGYARGTWLKGVLCAL